MKAESINTNTIGATGLCYLPGRIHLSHRKFQFGCSSSITNCRIRSWDHYARNSSDLMRLMPNSVTCWGKKRREPWQRAWEHGMQKHQQSPLLLSARGFNLILQKRNSEKHCHHSPLPACCSTCACIIPKTHFWPDWAPDNVKTLARHILPWAASPSQPNPAPVCSKPNVWSHSTMLHSPLYCTAFEGISAIGGKGGFTRLILMEFFSFQREYKTWELGWTSS